MTLGILMLCHTALDRAAQVARHWARAGCPVVIHLDRRVPAAEAERFHADLAQLPQISFARRYACEWGTWSLVAATQGAAEQMLARHPRVKHVYLASGMCLPLRPVSELVAYLDRHPQTDFIESVATADVGWTVGGLDIERFTLRFPFAWKRQRRLFDRYVALQRRLGLSRRLPKGLVPHLGSQWWCLSRATLSAILEDPQRPVLDRYFRRVWIPDESYFQTLARRWSCDLQSRSLTLSKFDHQGRPHVFYDDHLALLRRSDCFVARKIWPHAGQLYDSFLNQPEGSQRAAEPNPGPIERMLERTLEQRLRGRPGLYMQSRMPRRDHENGKTAAPYAVLHGFSDLFGDVADWLTRCVATPVHGHLFAPARAEFALGETMAQGALSDSAPLRDHDPRAFLTNLIWNTRGERQIFQFSPRDNQACNWLIATDPHAQIAMITGAWAIPLSRSAAPFDEIRAEAARLHRIETAHLNILRSMYVKARLRVWSLADVLDDPLVTLQTLLGDLMPNPPRLTEMPRMAALEGFADFLTRLRNHGLQPTLVGNLSTTEAPRIGRDRPYLVQ